MKIIPVQSRILKPPQDDLLTVLSSLPIKNQDILVITSKVVSIHQGRCVKIDESRKEQQKQELILQEAEAIVPLTATGNLKQSPLTKKYGVVVGSSGIDESNGHGYFILWPVDLAKWVKDIYQWLKATYNLTDLGIIISDTVKRPFRRGAIGIAIAHYGFKALRSYRGSKDIFGRKFKSEQVNLADALAASAVMVMGEGDEQTPLAIISDLENIEFFSGTEEITVAGEDDYFAGLIDNNKWKKRSQ